MAAPQQWREWANAPVERREPRREYGLATRFYRRPRVGQVLGGATGPELIREVHDDGRHLVVTDRHDRTFHLFRAEHGVWTVYVDLVGER